MIFFAGKPANKLMYKYSYDLPKKLL